MFTGRIHRDLYFLIGFSVPPFGILIAITLEMILVQCASYSREFRSEFSKVGGLKCLMLLLHKASDEELNKVCKYNIMLLYF